jgi:hypothetical protein
MNTITTCEKDAKKSLSKWMAPLRDREDVDVFACPWLRYWMDMGKTQDQVQGMLILQDWGLDENGAVDLEYQVKGIQNSFSETPEKKFEGEFEDATIKNMKNVSNLKKKIAEGTLVVMNAVWGCRKKAKKSGYLGNEIHRAAFPIWSAVVNDFAIKDNFFVLFAGDWARFEKMTIEDTVLQSFLDRWAKWANKKESDFSKVKGKAYFCAHPCTWRIAGKGFNEIMIQEPEDWFKKLE